MDFIHKRILCPALAAAVLGSAAAQASELPSSVMSLSVSENGNVSMTVNKRSDDTGKGLVAVYTPEGRLEKLVVSDEAGGTGEKTLVFNSALTADNSGIVKAFLWKTANGAITIEPLSDVFTQSQSDTTDEPEETSSPVEEGFKAEFVTDEHVSITVSATQDFADAEANAAFAYARNSATGEIDTTGDGQINFKVVLDEGYEVDSVTVNPSNYKNLKLPSELGECTYRITKVTGDITITVTTKQISGSGDEGGGEEIGDGIIHLLGDSIDAKGIANVTVNGTTVTITAAGEYTIDGTLDDGQIIVNSSAKTDLITINLDGVYVTSSTGNAFDGQKGKVTLVPGSESTFVSGSSGADTTAIYSKNDLTIKGSGTLNAVSEHGNGIRCKNDLEIGECDLNVTAANNGIKGDESVKITKKNNSVTVVSGGDGIKSDTAPSYDETTGEYVSGGTVTINGGKLNITANTSNDGGTVSNGDGIQADTLITISGGNIDITAAGEAIKANASSIEYLEDPTITETPAEGDGCVLITGGTLRLSAGEDGIKAVKNVTVGGSADITITNAQEGIQVNEVIYDTDETTILGIVEGEINISGGKLNVTCSEDGIQCGSGNISITSGEVTINSQQDCIQSENITNISGGVFDLTAYGGAPQTVSENNPEAPNSCKGVKAAKLVYISGGEFNINTYDDAIHSNHTVRITGGSITAATGDDGVHGDCYLYISDNANINITKSYEGIEAAEIYVSGGETRIVSRDDGANAAGDKPTGSAYDIDSEPSAELLAGPGGFNPGGNGGPNWGGEDTSSYGYLEVSGGLLYIEAEGDGFDSNGSGLIRGGTVLVNGPTSGGNGVFDIGDNSDDTLSITGGTIIGAGTSDMAVTPDSAKQYYVVTSSGSGGMGRPGQQQSSGFSSQSAGKAFKLTDAGGNEIITYVPSKSYSWVFVSTPDITSGTYTLNYGGTVTGGTFTGKGSYGIVTGGTYSGSSSCTLTATSK